MQQSMTGQGVGWDVVALVLVILTCIVVNAWTASR